MLSENAHFPHNYGNDFTESCTHKSLDVHTWIYFKNAPWDGISRLVGIKGQMASEQ